MLTKSFKRSDLPEKAPFSVLPAGKYSLMIVSAQEKTTQAGNGQFISLRLDVTGPDRQGAVLWENIFTDHPTETVVTSGLVRLNEIMTILDIDDLTSLDQLKGRFIDAEVVVKKDKENNDVNRIKKFMKSSGDSVQSSAGSVPDFDDDGIPF